MMGIAKEMIRGNRHDVNNPFRWARVRLNLPGMRDYDPSTARVSKQRESGAIASDLFVYVDDLRVTGSTEEDCRAAMRQTGFTLGYLGIQDAARKRRPPMQAPGAWAGAVFDTRNGVSITVTKDLRLSCDKLVEVRVREIHKRLVIKLCAKLGCCKVNWCEAEIVGSFSISFIPSRRYPWVWYRGEGSRIHSWLDMTHIALLLFVPK